MRRGAAVAPAHIAAARRHRMRSANAATRAAFLPDTATRRAPLTCSSASANRYAIVPPHDAPSESHSYGLPSTFAFAIVIIPARTDVCPRARTARALSCHRSFCQRAFIMKAIRNRKDISLKVIVYTDGSSRGNPGPGGYGAVLRYTAPSGKLHTLELSRGYDRTTNNRMELLGVISALEALNRPCEVEVHSDSQYVCNAFNQHWVEGWIRRGSKTSREEARQERGPVEAPAGGQGTAPRDLPLGEGPRRPRVQRALRRTRHQSRRRHRPPCRHRLHRRKSD